METYESLHKEYVKNPYRLSNKKNIEIQIMKTVSFNLIYKTLKYNLFSENMHKLINL